MKMAVTPIEFIKINIFSLAEMLFKTLSASQSQLVCYNLLKLTFFLKIKSSLIIKIITYV